MVFNKKPLYSRWSCLNYCLSQVLRKQGALWGGAKGHLRPPGNRSTYLLPELPTVTCKTHDGVYNPSCEPKASTPCPATGGAGPLQGFWGSAFTSLIKKGIFSCAWLDNNIWLLKIQLKWLFWKSFYFPAILFHGIRIKLLHATYWQDLYFLSYS